MSERDQKSLEINTKIAEACQLMSRYGANKIDMKFQIIDGSEFDCLITQTKKKT